MGRWVEGAKRGGPRTLGGMLTRKETGKVKKRKNRRKK